MICGPPGYPVKFECLRISNSKWGWEVCVENRVRIIHEPSGIHSTTMYYFFVFSYDATDGSCFARMVNDSKKYRNCKMRVIMDNGIPYLCLFAMCNLPIGTELRYNYGEKETNLPWRKKVRQMKMLLNKLTSNAI
jgi:hypothetical protein